MEMNRKEEAYNRWQNAVDNYFRYIDSYYALVGLVEAGQTVNEFQRGLVDYFARQYGVALAAFDRSIAQNPSHDGTALHYKALTLRELGEHQAAFDLWNEFIQKYPDNAFWLPPGANAPTPNGSTCASTPPPLKAWRLSPAKFRPRPRPCPT